VIRYALMCQQGHAFESWFQSSAAFDSQVARKLLVCPSCGSPEVEKAVMAPSVATSTRRTVSPEAPSTPERPPGPVAETRSPVAILSQHERELRAKLKELREQLIRNADYVGTRFPEEARKMHYGEIEHRSIYGEASPDDAASLAEEGIEFHPLPHLPDERN
jgi:hypothetical protein